MAITIEQVKITNETPFTYQLSFIYDGNNLETDTISKTVKLPEVKDIVRAKVDDFDLRRDKTNFDKIIAFFLAATVSL